MGLTSSRAQSIAESEAIIAKNKREVKELEELYAALPFGDPARVVNRRMINYKRHTIGTHKAIILRLRKAEPYLGEPDGIVSVPAPSSNKRSK